MTEPAALPAHWPAGVPRQLPPPQHSLWQLLQASARRTPDKTAVAFYDSLLRYRTLLQQTEALAGFLQQRCGVQHGDRVLLLSQNCPQFIAASYGVLRADAAVVPVNAMWTAAEVQHVLADSGARVAIVAQELLASVAPSLADGTLRHVVVITYADALTAPTDTEVPAWVKAPRTALPPFAPGRGPGSEPDTRCTHWSDALAAGLQPNPHQATPADLAALLYTSGTTGRPKGCTHTHATLQSANRASAAWRGLSSDEVMLGVAPLFHALGMQNAMHLPLMLGGTTVLLPRWDRQAALLAIERYRVTCWGSPPAMLIDFFANPEVERHDLSSLRLMYGGSSVMPEAVSAMLKERYGIDYHEAYGLTETASFLHCNPVNRPKRTSLGLPGPGVHSRIIDPETRAVLPPNELGEIVTHGPQVMAGYWNNPQADADVFITIDGLRYLRTGDLGHVDDDGYFFITDRLKRMVNVSGYKVWPAEVEASLYAHPAIHEACVIAVKDARQGESVQALVVLKPGAALTADELIAWARARMAVYKAPRLVAFVDHLPKSGTGKIQWRELQDQANAGR